jgi:serine/threonine protein kinase/tetratricopeptide (TPR) repeat protein
MARRWNEGERPKTEDFLARYPKLAEAPQAALELVYEEMCQRQRAGDAHPPATWLRRFPQWQPQIEVLLACHDLLENAGPSFPEPGETFGEFELLDHFGQGAHGRVYLARQPSLADRPVVLKLASLAGQEHLSLARLQHTYIMPLYWAQDDAAAGLRALCMPYFGGASLAQLLARLASIPPARRTGRDLLRALTAASEAKGLAPPVQGPACRFLEQASYIEAICTIGACLAEALDYAHQRNVVHHDLKPSNVLIAADGQPLLLDFHLAQPALEAGADSVAWLGGTPGYMAPEHEAALAAIEAGRPIPRRVDGSADIFSLGLLLCECLAGERPAAGEPPPRWLRRRNPKVSVALADLLAKCTARQPSQRYPDGAALAGDLRRHLAQQPLKHTTNRSLTERWRKWRRRRPYALLAMFLVVALVGSSVAITNTVRQRSRDARQALQEAQKEIEAGRFKWAKVAIERGLHLAGELPWHGALWRDLQAAADVADHGDLLQQLHTIVGQVREFYGDDSMGDQNATRLESDALRLWKSRQKIVGAVAAGGPWPQLPIKDDLTALAIAWANLHVRGARQTNARTAAAEAMEVLGDAERLTGARLVLCREQQRLARLLGDDDRAAKAAQKAATLQPASAWEQYALGRIAFAAGDFGEADRYFLAAIDAEPTELWSNLYHGRAAYELKDFEEAVSAFAVCIALAHEKPWCYYNRGLAYLHLARPEAARRDFDRALELNPHLAAASLDRGMLSYNEQRYDEALADLLRASSDGAEAGSVAYGLALVYAAQGDRTAAVKQLDVLFSLKPEHEGGKKLAEHLQRETE